MQISILRTVLEASHMEGDEVSIRLGSNISSISTQRKLGQVSNDLSKIFERLSTGQRINHAGDDAAGLSIASTLSARSRVFGQAIKNGNDGLSLLNIADATLTQLSEITQRQQELAAQAASGTFTKRQRLANQAEANALVREYNRILSSTKFNGQTIFSSSQNTDFRLQLGFGVDGSIRGQLSQNLQRDINGTTFTGLTSLSFPLPGGNSSGSYITGDFNGDGNLDIVAKEITPFDQEFEFFSGVGNGNFSDEGAYNIAASGDLIGAADLNRDGLLDFVLSDGTFYTYDVVGFNWSSQSFPGAIAPTSALKTADFNGDGVTDLAFNSASGTRIMIANGDGTFGPSVGLGFGVVAFEFGDFNADGKDDIAYNAGGTLNVRFGAGNGTFSSANTIASVNLFPYSVTDLNADGLDDIVAYAGGQTGVFLSNGGTFSMSASIGGAYTATYDFNQDGAPDLVDPLTGTLRLNTGNGTFMAAVTIASSSGIATTYADFNNDSVLDRVVYDGSQSIQINFGVADKSISEAFLDFTTQSSARAALHRLTDLRNDLQLELSNVGALSSRIATSLSSLDSTRQALFSARSRIIDADVATESAEQSRLRILQQSGVAVLAQANIVPQLALTLLGS